MNRHIVFILILIFNISATYAENNNEYNKIIENLRCLVCQNQSLSESDSNLAKDLRSKVKSMLDSGKSEKEIYKFMSDRYTDYVLYNPPLKKSTFLLWYGPFLILIAASQHNAVSNKSAGRNTLPFGIDLSILICSIGWCVGPSSPKPIESCVNTRMGSICINAANLKLGFM